MYCNKCGKKIDEDSIFCQFCGNKIAEDNSSTTSESKSSSKTKNRSDLLWEKFVEIYDAENGKREEFDSYSSNFIWEILERMSLNAFESFIQENKEELNKLPYKTIEALKNVYTWIVVGGYRLWLAEALLDNKKLSNFRSFSMEDYIAEWKKYDFDKALKTMSEEVSLGIPRYADFRFNGLMEISPEIKEISNSTIEKLKSSLLFQTVFGYHAGKLENSFRK